MKAVFQTFIYGAVFISLCTVALCMETSLLLGLPYNSFYFYLTVFSATLGQYNIHYYIKRSANPDSDRFFWSVRHRKIHLIFNCIGAIGLIVGLTGLHPKNYLVLAIVAAITILYSFPFLPFKNKKRLKDFGLLKILVLAYVWTLITVWFPAITLTEITKGFEVVFLQRFVFIFILCLAFDIRDIQSDTRENIHTVPVSLGEKKSYLLATVLLVVFLGISFYHFRITQHFMQFNAMLLSALATWFILEISKKQKSDLFFLAAVDGMMLLQPLLVAIGAIR